MADSARIVIVGGGVIGLGLAFHLAEMGVTDVLLVERFTLTSGTSWHAAGIVGPLRASLNLTRLAQYATELFPKLEAITGQASGYRQMGGVWLARRPERMIELQRIARTGEASRLRVEMIGPAAVKERVPSLDVASLEGALWVDEDGQANPVDVCDAYARGARAKGIRIRENTLCTGFERHNGRVSAVRLSSGETVTCHAVVNCGGAWARCIGALAGVPVPLQAVEHMYVVTEPISGLPDPFPIVRDLDEGIYLKGDAGKLVLGGFEPHAKLFDVAAPEGNRPFVEMPEDWEQFEPFITAGLRLVPQLAEAGIRHFMNGPESFTPDTRPLLGESPYLRGFFVAAGFNSTGMMSSAGAGKAMAEWVVDGKPSLDLWALDIARFDRAAASSFFVAARTEETVADLFRMHWPLKQAEAGRGVRRSPLHAIFKERGAVFGMSAGWERPFWFAADEDERAFRYGFGPQSWWPAATREAQAMAAGVGLFELSPFTKIDVNGPDALELLQHLCANELDVAEGRAVYTQMLNDAGGIEADVTVTRTGEQSFRVTSGVATRGKDLAWLRRGAQDGGLDVQVFDATSGEAVIGVMGPRSRALLSGLTDADLSEASFPFSTARRIAVGMADVWATRISFVGELGWELSVPAEFAAGLLETLLAAGEGHGLALCGHLALDGCRHEKAFRHWGHDLGPNDTPLEAGLGFAVAWNKPRFKGREALLRQRQRGVSRRLIQFAVEDEALLLHDEPVFSDGRLAGLTTSGGRGFRTAKNLCFANVACEPGESRDAVLRRSYEIALGAERLPLNPLAQAPYDPAGHRMRA